MVRHRSVCAMCFGGASPGLFIPNIQGTNKRGAGSATDQPPPPQPHSQGATAYVGGGAWFGPQPPPPGTPHRVKGLTGAGPNHATHPLRGRAGQRGKRSTTSASLTTEPYCSIKKQRANLRRGGAREDQTWGPHPSALPLGEKNKGSISGEGRFRLKQRSAPHHCASTGTVV